MIVVDTSAVVAVLFGEPQGAELGEVLMSRPCAMSAATRVELGIVIEAKTGAGGTQLLEELLARADVRVIDVDTAVAAEALVAWRRYGKGRHPAALDLGDTFAYATARHLGCPLLFVGDDFTRTDIEAA